MSDALLEIVQLSLSSAPEEMLCASLQTCIRITGASGGSVLAEEGPHLKFLFSNAGELIGRTVPFESLAGHCMRSNRVIYTYAPSDSRHYGGVDSETMQATRYLLSIPLPSIHQSASDKPPAAGAVLQLLFDDPVCSNIDVSAGACEFEVERFRESDAAAGRLAELFMILPLLVLGLEVMTLRQTSYQAIHELKNKLIAAHSWLDYLKEDLTAQNPAIMENAAVAEDFELAESSVRQGSELAKTWLQFTKMYQPDFEEVQITGILERVAASARALAREAGCAGFTVKLETTGEIPERQLDAAKLEMAFYNLCKNAVEALVEHNTEAPQILISCRNEDGRLLVTVADNGPGMPSEIAGNLFIAFKTKKEGGTGLGLTIAKKIVDLHGGSIECFTGAEGTRFVVGI